MSYIVTVRGRLADPSTARETHDRAVETLAPIGRELGSTGHRAYLSTEDPTRFLAIDRWPDLEALQRFMSDERAPRLIGELFDGPPDITVYEQTDWMGYEV